MSCHLAFLAQHDKICAAEGKMVVCDTSSGRIFEAGKIRCMALQLAAVACG